MEVAPRIHRIEAPFGERFVCLFLLVGEMEDQSWHFYSMDEERCRILAQTTQSGA